MHTENRNKSGCSDDTEYDESIAQLSVVLAHRLRGLVAGIEGFTELLQDSLIEADQRELAMKIMEGTARIESVLADLQLFGASIDPVMLPVRVDDVLRKLLLPLEDSDRERISVDAEDDTASRTMLADPFLLRQALLVLLQNALEADRSRSEVVVRVIVRDAAVRFEVWNDGTIDLDAGAEKLFTPFFTTKANNLGVGLTIARRIARLHDGSIEVDGSTATSKTCFTFLIPDARLSGMEKLP